MRTWGARCRGISWKLWFESYQCYLVEIDSCSGFDSNWLFRSMSESFSISDSTRMERITRMRADTIIRENPSDPCHPCSRSILLYSQRFPALYFCWNLGAHRLCWFPARHRGRTPGRLWGHEGAPPGDFMEAAVWILSILFILSK